MNNKQVLITIILGFLYLTSYTQTPQWNWANYGYGDILQGAFDIASDANGNAYITGQTWSQDVYFPQGSSTITLANGSISPNPSMFVASYDVYTGKLNWATSANSGDSFEAYSICTGNDGIYVTGSYLDYDITFNNSDRTSVNIYGNNNTYSSKSYRTFYLVKYDFNGFVIWVSWIEVEEGSGTVFSATDPSGNVYITGPFTGNLAFYSSNGTPATCTLNNSNQYNTVFIASYDASGNFRWAEDASSSEDGNALGTSVTTDASSNVYLAGYFEGSSITFSNNYYCQGTSMTCTANPSCSINSIRLPNTGNATAGDVNMFLVKFDNCGNLCTAITNDLGPDIDTPGNTTFNNHESGDYWITISADNNTQSNIYMTGIFTSPKVTFNCTPGTLTNNGSTEIFLAKFNDNLNAQWATNAVGNNYDFANSVHVNCNDIYITGNFNSSSITFGSIITPNPNPNLTTEPDVQSIFLADFKNDGTCSWVQTVGAGGTAQDCNNGFTQCTEASCANGWCNEYGGDYPFGVTTDISGNIDIAGFYFSPSPSATMTFGSYSLPNPSTSYTQNCNIFIAQYSANNAITTNPSPAIICEGSSATLTASGAGTGGTYAWSGPGLNTTTESTVIATPTATTTYTMTATNSNGCPSIVSVIVTVYTIPTSVVISPQTLYLGFFVNGFTATVSPTGFYTYQWYKDNILISGATNSTYYPYASGTYTCIVSAGSCGSMSGSGICTYETVIVQNPIWVGPAIYSYFCSGNDGLLTTDVSSKTGTSVPITYTWVRGDNSVITGATNSTYNIVSVSIADTGNYACIVTDTSGNNYVQEFYLTLNTSPLITNTLDNSTLCAGGTTNFSINANGGSLSYQWNKIVNSQQTTVNSATQSQYSIASCQLSDAGNYYCNCTNGCGSVSSNTVTLTVNSPPTSLDMTIVSDYQTDTGYVATFITSVEGTQPFSYQWYVNRQLPIEYNEATLMNGLQNKTNNALNETALFSDETTLNYKNVTFNNSNPADTGNFICYCIASNACGADTTTNSLYVGMIPSITQQPISDTICQSSIAYFYVSVIGSKPINYQWYKNDTLIAGANDSDFVILSALSTDAGNYKCVVGNTWGTTESNLAVLTVNSPPSITVQPVSADSCQSSQFSFNITASGTTPINYQWQKFEAGSWMLEAGETTNSYQFTNISVTDAGNYYCVVSNMCGSVTSNEATLNVKALPIITQQPVSKSGCQGTTVNLEMFATGYDLFYAWYKNDSIHMIGRYDEFNLLPLPNITTTDAGNYKCVVYNECASVTTNEVTVTVNTSPAITEQPQSVTSCQSSVVSFNVNAEGIDLTYKWHLNGFPISYATQSQYSISSCQSTDAGTYSCLISNECGNSTSSGATLTVNTSPTASLTYSGAYNDITFNAVATGTSPISYEWLHNSEQLTVNSEQYTINNVGVADTGKYVCVVNNICGANSSNVLTLVYTCSGPPRLLKPEQETTNNISVNIYPNPNNGTFTLQVQLPDAGDVEVEAYDLLGQVVLTEKQGMNKGINTTNMSINNGCCGVYFIVVKTVDKTFYKKMIIE